MTDVVAPCIHEHIGRQTYLGENARKRGIHERIMTQALQTGFLDKNSSVSYTKLGAKDIDTPAHQELARNAAEQSAVVLKNEGGLLPLSPKAKVAVLGLTSTAVSATVFGESSHPNQGPQALGAARPARLGLKLLH